MSAKTFSGWVHPGKTVEQVMDMIQSLGLTNDEHTLRVAASVLVDEDMYRVAWMAMLDLDVERRNAGGGYRR